MTFWGATHRLLRLATGDLNEWRYICYLIDIRRRGMDLGFESMESLGLPAKRAKVYSDSGGPDLETVLRSLPVSPEDRILDLGCGKGGAMLTMARAGFHSMGGVDLSPRLLAVARANLNRAGVVHASLFCCDAAAFLKFEDYRYLYMYNPFPQAVMRDVVRNILESLPRRKNPLNLIYRHPVDHAVLVEAGFRKVRDFRFCVMPYPPAVTADRAYSIYELNPQIASAPAILDAPAAPCIPAEGSPC